MRPDVSSLSALAEEHLATAHRSSSGRSAITVFGGREHDLRQTLIALTAQSKLHEHESPGDATLIVLQGDVRLVAGDEAWDGGPGDHILIPPRRHELLAITDAVVLLTVATRS